MLSNDISIIFQILSILYFDYNFINTFTNEQGLAMKTLREYIDLIEQAKTDEGFGQRMVPTPVFGRRTEPQMAKPTDSEALNRLDRANQKQYPNAHQYAIHNHSEWPMYNTDPPQLQAQIKQKYDALAGEWNGWKKAGFIK